MLVSSDEKDDDPDDENYEDYDEDCDEEVNDKETTQDLIDFPKSLRIVSGQWNPSCNSNDETREWKNSLCATISKRI